MTRPSNLTTLIFLDSGDPRETQTILDTLGFLDGQTTNPSLIAKNPDTKTRLDAGQKFTKQEIYDFYRTVIRDIASIIPHGSISAEVYADDQSTSDQLYQEGAEMFSWIPNAQIKYPTITAGLAAAEKSVNQGMRVNMTLVFTQAQAAAVHAATTGAKHPGDVYVSPFIGRHDDQGRNGISLVDNINRMYRENNSQVMNLAASSRTYDHFLACLSMDTDIITANAQLLLQWAADGMPVPQNFDYDPGDLIDIPYENLDLSQPWSSFDITHYQTDDGLARFASDWNNLLIPE